jgi:hypothetical protein
VPVAAYEKRWSGNGHGVAESQTAAVADQPSTTVAAGKSCS